MRDINKNKKVKYIQKVGRIKRYNKCPSCGYYAFNGQECFDCRRYSPR